MLVELIALIFGDKGYKHDQIYVLRWKFRLRQ